METGVEAAPSTGPWGCPLQGALYRKGVDPLMVGQADTWSRAFPVIRTRMEVSNSDGHGWNALLIALHRSPGGLLYDLHLCTYTWSPMEFILHQPQRLGHRQGHQEASWMGGMQASPRHWPNEWGTICSHVLGEIAGEITSSNSPLILCLCHSFHLV